VVKNRDGKETRVCQVGWAGIKLGRVDFYVERGRGKKKIEGSALSIHEKWDWVLINNSTNCASTFEKI
jgi:5'-nucleotidase